MLFAGQKLFRVHLCAIALSMALFMAAGAELPKSSISPPQVPDKLKPTGAVAPVFKGLATGVQIYTCKADGAWSSPAAPDAILLDDLGTIQMHHYKGPTWEMADGSKVKGVLPALASNSPDADSIPWLLLKASGTGKLTGVQFVQRTNTKGGKAPATCDASHVGTEARVAYKATYYFYSTSR